MPYVTSLWVIFLLTGNFSPLTAFTHFAPTPPDCGNQQFVLCIYEFKLIAFFFLDYTSKWDHIVFAFLSLTFHLA